MPADGYDSPLPQFDFVHGRQAKPLHIRTGPAFHITNEAPFPFPINPGMLGRNIRIVQYNVVAFVSTDFAFACIKRIDNRPLCALRVIRFSVNRNRNHADFRL
jgi:hypothetical protein